jgi:hypothetical protein
MTFRKYEFSLFADLGDLTQFSFESLKEKIATQYSLVVKNENDKIIATWSDKYTELVVYYFLDGRFMKIKSETWKELGYYFDRN